MTKILIIEDEEPIRRVLKKILTEENDNFLLSEAEDGKHGIKLILEEDYDLILCDIKTVSYTHLTLPTTPYV